MAKFGGMDSGSLHFWCLDHIGCEQMLILGYVDKTLIISPFDDIWTHQKFVFTWFTYLFDHMHEKNSQFILLKIPSHLVRLLGKIHALSIEVLTITIFWITTTQWFSFFASTERLGIKIFWHSRHFGRRQFGSRHFGSRHFSTPHQNITL